MSDQQYFSTILRKSGLLKGSDAKKTPAKPSERKQGSSKNKPGSAKDARGGITLSAATIKTLKTKVAEHNKSSKKKTTLGQLKAVYRRGSGAFSTSHHPKANRHSWSMGRVNSFLRRLKGGDGHSQDDDLIKKADSYVVPAGVRSAAKRGLALRKKQPKSGKAGLDISEASKQGIGSGVARARDLMSGRVSKNTIKRMHAYFSRHQSNYKLDAGKAPHEDKGYVAGLLWGGEAGRSFAARMVKKFEREESSKKKKKSLGTDFVSLAKAYKENKSKQKNEEKKTMEAREPESKDSGSGEGAAPRSVYEIVKAAGSEGANFDDIVQRYAHASGQKVRNVNRVSIRYSLDKMADSGKIKALNRDGMTVYVAGSGGE